LLAERRLLLASFKKKIFWTIMFSFSASTCKYNLVSLTHNAKIEPSLEVQIATTKMVQKLIKISILLQI
jgi:hypothetical protein